MQGASPLASPGAEPERRLLALPLWYPAGGVPPALPARRALAVPCGGLPSLLPAYPAFSWHSFPHPPAPFPSGEGGDFLFSYARGFAPCIPGAEPGRHRSRSAYHALAGGLPGWLPADFAVPESAGVACLACRLPPLPLALILPLSPQPPSRREGGDFLFSYARGFAPCIPGAEPTRHWFALPLWKTQWGGLPRRCRRGGRQRYPAGGVPALSPACPATAVPAGGVPALSPVNPAFNLLSCPHPPTPFPAGRELGGWGRKRKPPPVTGTPPRPRPVWGTPPPGHRGRQVEPTSRQRRKKSIGDRPAFV